VIEGAILIAGPTASGKSRLALDLASRFGGVIVNTDSMQVYSVLRVLTARPGEADLLATPHLLYGHIDPSLSYSTGQWLRDVQGLTNDGVFSGLTPIFVGGTGLYFRALTGGIAEMPAIPEAVRAKWRSRLNVEGSAKLHRVLATVDARASMQINASDGQRIVRALEIVEASGRSQLDWQMEKGRPLVNPATAKRFVLTVDRDLLHKRIELRFDSMVEGGALNEVRELANRALDSSAPAMRAIGVPELSSYLAGEFSIDLAIERAKAATRQYAKRQLTWFRNQMGPEWRRIGGMQGI
jgi:tRNA dimethylallyltransferase